MMRRSFLSYGIGMLAVAQELFAAPQKAAMQDGKAIVCDSEVLTCPLGHKTCPSIDALMVVSASANVDHPDYATLPNYHLERCGKCGVLFTRE